MLREGLAPLRTCLRCARSSKAPRHSSRGSQRYSTTPSTSSGQSSRSSVTEFIRPFGGHDSSSRAIVDEDFRIWPGFYSSEDTRQLLAAALWKLDRSDMTRRRRRRSVSSSSSSSSDPSDDDPRARSALVEMFHGEYGFEPGHYDTVIHQYRESLMSTLPTPSSSYPDLIPLLNKAYGLLPSSPVIKGDLMPSEAITHLLHLSPEGEIKGHVDNTEASGGVILGICLGADRILRLSRKSSARPEASTDARHMDLNASSPRGQGDKQGWDILLRNGTVYLQKDRLRYQYEHAILPYGTSDSSWEGESLVPGHRVSIMMRDALSK